MISIKTGERMKDKVQFVITALLGIVAFILFFGFVLSNIDPDNKLEAYTLAISFVGIFATFGGAYLGAKIAGENALNLKEKEIKYERKKEYIMKHHKMLSDLESKGFNTIKQELNKWNNNLLNENEQVYACVLSIKEVLKQIKSIHNEVEITDIICENKFKEIQKNIETFEKIKWVNGVHHNLDASGKKRVNENLINDKHEIFRLIKKIEYSLDGIPKYDIYELEKGLR
ncbi:hypothetical protein CD117_02920 [Mammaliicoccus sciuri]|uniref:Uncharacterized protein n=2 Tax=Mammaliicoccus sciuri TaxID=1296 RepID=A0AAJ4SJG7_MAMSC|nr:hypothetical protein CD117_02920 [Mammaliicoccus sciuri]